MNSTTTKRTGRTKGKAWVARAALAAAALIGATAVGQPMLGTAGTGEPGGVVPASPRDAQVTPPDQVLGFRLGDRPATPGEVDRCLKTWAGQGGRTQLIEYAQSVEGRGLSALVVTSPENLARLEDIKRDTARLFDARTIAPAEAAALAARTPAVAWMGYTIHGDELSGTDAGLALAYHLASATDPATVAMLEKIVVIIDPLMNPDGRERALTRVSESRGAIATTDDQARLHEGWWPYGRTNHYLFDMNRDWIFAICPETRGRIKEIGSWNPLLLVDAHEMGAQDTYLFTPSREPINPNFPGFARRWLERIADDHAKAFDAAQQPYYTGEWADDWYPGYSNAWATYRGGVGILYEQAGVHFTGVKRPEGRVLTYAESVGNQFRSSMANLQTMVDNLAALREEWLEARREAVADDGRYGARVFALPPSANAARMRHFLDNMLLQGVEVSRATAAFSAGGIDSLGQSFEPRDFPAGTLLIENRQPLAPFIAAMLEFDPRMVPEFLEKEREQLLRRGETEIYDITGWSLPMLYDLEAYELAGPVTEQLERVASVPTGPASGVDRRDALQGWAIDGADDRTPAAAVALSQAGVRVRVADEAFAWGGVAMPRGSLVVTRIDQRTAEAGWLETLDAVTKRYGLAAVGVDTGLGAGDIADIGGSHFMLLPPHRIALVGGAGVDANEFGSLWYTLDGRYGLAATVLNADGLGGADLRRYNVIVMPSGSTRRAPMDDLRTWVEQGGTLIATGDAALALADEDGLSGARELSATLEDLDPYEVAVLRELVAQTPGAGHEAAWAFGVTDATPVYPWEGIDLDRGSKEELERRDDWERQFMPVGTVLAARVDEEHWLTAGCGAVLPMLFSGSDVLMADGSVECPVRFGVPEVRTGDEAEEAVRIGWSTLPGGVGLRLRMSGLLWPEAARRIANSAGVTREGVGNGQVILFPQTPTFRASALGTTRVFMNAVGYGPGLGAGHPILP